MSSYEIINGNCIEQLRLLPSNSVNMCVTSPPYWGLRDYGGENIVWGAPECIERGEGDTSHEWEVYMRRSENDRKNDNSLQIKSAYWKGQEQAYCKHCDAWFGQLGLEPTPEQYVKNMVMIFREVRRVLKDDGTLWLNIGDSYANGKGRKNTVKQSIENADEEKYGELLNESRPSVNGHPVLKDKDMVGIPFKLAFALQEDGWWLRQDIIWAKPNCMPESVRDRFTRNHEYIFLLSKNANYYFDHEEAQEPVSDTTRTNFTSGSRPNGVNHDRNDNDICDRNKDRIYKTRNKRGVWWVSPKPFPEAHFAVFPIELIEPCILCGCPPDGTVLDPFGGSGTTAIASMKHGRNALLIELSEKYIDIAHRRIAGALSEMGLDKQQVEWI